MDEEEQRERERAEQSIMALREEKSKILAERKQKIQENASLLGGDSEEHKQLIKSHDENTQRLVNKIDAERLRMEADLHERLKKKREAKYKAKESEMKEELLKKRKQMEEIDRQRRQDLDKEEKEKLEQLQMSLQLPSGLHPKEMNVESDYEERIAGALPVTEKELTSLLLSSPLYQKLDEITVMLQNHSFGNSCHIDPKDALWMNDTEFHTIDVSMLSPKAFVIYKFGCYIIKLLVSCCSHFPVSLLVADKIPPNSHIKHNSFCNSFMYDNRNRILYMRLERLENVGEFFLILVHILSHIQVQSLDNDSDPRFVKEFYRCLSICCNDFFLSRYSGISPILSGAQVLQPTAEDGVMAQFVDDLLDSRLMTHTDSKPGYFRLESYAEVKFGSKLRVFLDQPAEDVQSENAEYIQSKMTDECNKEVSTTTKATRSLNKESYWRTLAKRALHKSSTHATQYQQFLKVQTRDLQERIQKLNAEYAQVVKERSDINTQVKKLETLLAAHQSALKTVDSSEFEAQKQKVKNTAIKLSAAKTEQATYDLKVNGCLKRLEGFKVQLSQKQTMLNESRM